MCICSALLLLQGKQGAIGTLPPLFNTVHWQSPFTLPVFAILNDYSWASRSDADWYIGNINIDCDPNVPSSTTQLYEAMASLPETFGSVALEALLYSVAQHVGYPLIPSKVKSRVLGDSAHRPQ